MKAGPFLYPAKGTVTFQGKPAAGAVLTFHRVGDPAKNDLPHAKVGDDGTFTVTTFVPGDGAAPGKYAITVIWRRKGKATGDDAESGFMIPLRYLTPETSGLSADIKPEPNRLAPFVLTK